MEALNNSLKNIIQFILCIQDACDGRRKCMECIWQEEYNSYINKWEQVQPECKSISVKNRKVQNSNASKCVQVNSDDTLRTEVDLDLVLVDSLLEKARDIRMKNKKLMSELGGCKTISTILSDKGITSSVRCDKKCTPGKIKTKETLPKSKSDIITKGKEKYFVPRSKSTLSVLPKSSLEGFCGSKSCTELSPKTSIVKHANSTESKMFKDFAVISSKDLDKLRDLQLNLPSSHNFTETIETLPLDGSGSKNPYSTSSHPSLKEFSSQIKERLNAASFEIKLKTWYPFLSTKSETFLTAFNCDSISSMKKVHTILCDIQEIMLWIDLLHLLEVDICPKLIVDETDIDSVRVYTVLRCLHDPNLQRKPILWHN